MGLKKGALSKGKQQSREPRGKNRGLVLITVSNAVYLRMFYYDIKQFIQEWKYDIKTCKFAPDAGVYIWSFQKNIHWTGNGSHKGTINLRTRTPSGEMYPSELQSQRTQGNEALVVLLRDYWRWDQTLHLFSLLLECSTLETSEFSLHILVFFFLSLAFPNDCTLESGWLGFESWLPCLKQLRS